jgi:hypothetical protein
MISAKKRSATLNQEAKVEVQVEAGMDFEPAFQVIDLHPLCLRQASVAA